MSTYSMLSSLDALSGPQLKGGRASWLGCIGSVLLVALCLGFYVPAAMSYFAGEYFQSMFETNNNFVQPLFSRDDFKIAMAIRNKQDGSFYNHSIIRSQFQAIFYYFNITASYQESLQLCDPQYFATDINGVVLDDCLMVPDFAEYDAAYSQGSYSSISLILSPPAFTNPFSTSVFTASLQQQRFTDIMNNYYCEFYFTSKVVTADGKVKFQLHRAYSTQINIASDTLAANLQVFAGLRSTLIDDSIMPWRNNRNITALSYTGKFSGMQALTLQAAAIGGVIENFRVVSSLEVAVRYYKKLDWLLGIIGGGIFLFYAIFWVFFNFYNRNAALFELANHLLLQKVTGDYPKSEEELISVKIPQSYMLRRLLPFCRLDKYEKMLQQAENHNNIVLLLKKLKVAVRNLKKKELLPYRHHAKVIDLGEIDKINQEETSKCDSTEQEKPKYDKLNDESHLDLARRKSQEKEEEVVEHDASEERGNVRERKNSPVIVQVAEIQRGEGLAGTHQPFLQEEEVPKQQQDKNMVFDKNMEFDKIDILPIQANIQEQPQVQEQPQPQPSSQSSRNIHQQAQAPQPIIIADPNLLVIPPGQQVIIIGNQQQISQLNLNQDFPREPSLLSDPQPLPEPITSHPARDDKFNLTPQQLALLRTTNDPKILGALENNATFQAMRHEKTNSFEALMELEELDKWEGHYVLRLKSRMRQFGDAVASFLHKLDPFSARVTFLDLSGSTTCWGLFLTLLILVLSILTFALTIANMNQTQYIISENYISTNDISFTKNTDNNFNAVLCITTPGYFLGVSKLASFNFFTTTNGITKTYAPVQMSPADAALNLTSNLHFVQANFNLSNCFRMPLGVPVTIDASGSHFGYTFTTYCSNTPSYCASTQTTTNSNFLNAVNTKNPFLLFLPGSRLNPNTNTLATDIYLVPYLNIDMLNMTQSMALQETAYGNQVRLYDDSGNSFMHHAPPLQDLNINFGYNTRRTYIKAGIASQPSYTLRVRLNQASTDYTVTQKKVDWILGIIGGVFVFWYAIVHLFVRLLNRFNFNAYVAKLIYEEQGYDASIIKKMLAILRVPRCLLPRCLDTRKDTDRMKAIDDKMEDTLTHLNILKYTQNCFRLSSAFFSSLQAKNFSLLYFREKIFDNEQVKASTPSEEASNLEPQEIMQEEVDEKNEKWNKVGNSMAKMTEEEKINQEKHEIETQGVKENIIDGVPTGVPNYFDLFSEPSSFSFRGARYFTSVTGGLCCLLMVLLIILVVVFEISLYLNNGGITTSYDAVMDDGVNSTGIVLNTGVDFKLGVNFYNVSTLQAVNVSSYLPYVGISILIQQYKRVNGVIIPNITTIDLVPCPSGYIESWVGSNLDGSYFSGLNYAYCVPNNIVLEISGRPESEIFKTFKVSIYNKLGNAEGLANVTKLLNTTYVMLYFSSPRQNSLARAVEYQMESILFAGLTPNTPFETNMTLSRSNVTYDDSHDWQAAALSLQTYRFQPYSQQWLGYEYYGTSTSNLWFNVSFSNTNKVHRYVITAPKFYEVFGIIGGVIAFFFFFIGCCAHPFNAYKLRYEIGKQLYLFDKRRIMETKEKIKMKLRKTTSDRKRTQRMNDLSEVRVLEAFLLRPVGWLTNNYNFNESLRTVTLIQDRISRDIDLPHFYLSLSRVRDALRKKLRQDGTPCDLLDVYLKQMGNPQPNAYNIEAMKNYAKQHNLSSLEQMVAYRAREARVRVQEIFDSKYLENQFNVVDDGSSIRMDMMADTIGSVNSSLASSFNESVAEHSVTGLPDDL